MAEVKAGDSFPSDVSFTYVPYTDESSGITSCGVPIKYDASKEWADKKVVLFSVPGAFTPGCSARHLPPYIEQFDTFKSKGVDIIAVAAFNDAWVMDAWSKANGIKDNKILFLSDPELTFASKVGWKGPAGGRLARAAMVIDHGKVVYAEKEPGKEVTVSGAENVLGKL